MFIFLSILLFSQISLAQNYRSNKDQLPKLELGVGLGAAFLPHYPGSDETHTLVLPFPAIVYRGEKIRSDEDGGNVRDLKQVWHANGVPIGSIS